MIAEKPIEKPTDSPLRLTLRMIKFEHTVFALPFALLSVLVASGGRPDPLTLFWILVAMVGARSTAMAFNRLADAQIDARNPRTSQREIPSGKLGQAPVWLFTIATAGIFVIAAWQLNRLCLMLSPVALAVVYIYSFTKRFTSLSHFVLGLGLSIAPIGAWIAVRGSFDWFPLVLGGGVLFWVAGFDIIYACQDIEFDRNEGLHSMSAKLGAARALRISRVSHVLAIVLFAWAGQLGGLGILYNLGVAAVAVLLAYEHFLVRGQDFTHIDKAFFQVNSYVGLVLLAFTATDFYLR